MGCLIRRRRPRYRAQLTSRALPTTSSCSRRKRHLPSRCRTNGIRSAATSWRTRVLFYAEGLGRSLATIPVRLLAMVLPPIHVAGEPLTSARDSPRRTFFPADRSRPAVTYTPTVHGWEPRIRAASARPIPSTGRSVIGAYCRETRPVAGGYPQPLPASVGAPLLRMRLLDPPKFVTVQRDDRWLDG
jgi:hypothetical protein